MLTIPIQNANRYSCYNFGDKTQNPNDLPVHQTLDMKQPQWITTSLPALNDRALTYLSSDCHRRPDRPQGFVWGVQQHFRGTKQALGQEQNNTACTERILAQNCCCLQELAHNPPPSKIFRTAQRVQYLYHLAGRLIVKISPV